MISKFDMKTNIMRRDLIQSARGRFCAGLGAAVLLTGATAFGAFAQQPPPGPPLRATPPAQVQPEVTVKSKHGLWIVRCEKLKLPVRQQPPQANKGGKGNKGDRQAAAAPGQTRTVEQCAMVQSLKPPQGQKVSMQVMFQKVKGPKGKPAMLMRMFVPLGVYLSDGIALQVDGKAVGRFPYTRCYPQACTATIPVQQKLLDQFRKGTSANFFVYAFPGKSINVPMDLKGFTKAQADL